MTNEVRSAIAFICTSYINRYSYTRLYDHSRSKYIPYNMQVNGYGFNMYDYDRGTYLNGISTQIFDFSSGNCIEVIYNGFSFSGTDIQSRKQFTGTVIGSNVSIYDEEVNQYFNYALQ